MSTGLYRVSSSKLKPLPCFELSGRYETYAMYIGHNQFVLDIIATYFKDIKIKINGTNYMLRCIKKNYDLFLSLWEIDGQLDSESYEPCQFSDQYDTLYAIDISRRRRINIQNKQITTSPHIHLNLYKTNQINLNEIVINEQGHIIGIANKNNLITPSKLIQLFINPRFETFKIIPLKINSSGKIENTFGQNNGLQQDDIIQSINDNNINLQLNDEHEVKLIRDGTEMIVNVIPQPQDEILKFPLLFNARNFKIINGYLFAYLSHELFYIYKSILQKNIILSRNCEKVLNNEVIIDNNTFGKKDIYLIDYRGNTQLNFPFKDDNSIIWHKIINFDSLDLLDGTQNIRIRHEHNTYTINF